MIVAITGATGFVGRALVLRHLAAGDRVRALTRRAPGTTGLPEAVECHAGDLGGAGPLPAAFADGADVLYHCAGELRDATRMQAVHVDGTARLIELARGRIGRWVQLSSVGAYGPRRDGVITERTALAPVNAYERSKTQADTLVRQAGGFGWTILRPSIVFGEAMPNASLRQLVRAISRGLFFFIGPPGATANYIHVDDVVDALHGCGSATAAQGEVFNLSDDCTLEAFVGEIAAALGRAPPRVRLPEMPVRLAARLLGSVPGFPLTGARIDALTARCRYPIDHLAMRLGYAPRRGWAAGLRALVAASPAR